MKIEDANSSMDGAVPDFVREIETDITSWLDGEAAAKKQLQQQKLAEDWSGPVLAERLRQATLTPDTLAQSKGISEHTLRSRLLEAGARFTVGDMIVHGRLDLAARMLTTRMADTQIIDIAQACGWDDPRRFAVSFKAFFGMAPVEYRERRLAAKSG